VAVQYLDVNGITEAAKTFRSNIDDFNQCVIDMNKATNNVLRNWVGKGRNQFETQMSLMKKQLDDISEGLYDIYNALVDSEEGYIEEDENVAKQFDSARA
jgi:WXG100 family type VII secretion target